MNIKSLLLGSAAALVAVSGARAADAIIAEPEPVEYVRVCDVYGSGFFYIPGTETCLRIGGEVRYQIGTAGDFGSYHGFQPDTWTKHSRGRFFLDARSETEWGTLRGFIRYDARRDEGSDTSNLNKAFIELGGLKIGWEDSAFVFTPNAGAANYGSHSDSGLYYGYQQRHLIQYNFSGGNGFFGTVSLEDDVNTVGGVPNPDADYIPDVVVKAGINQAWGALWAAVGYDSERNPNLIADDDDSGFGVVGGVHINMPNSPGSSFRLLGFYSDELNAYSVGSEWSVLASYYHQFNPQFGASVGFQYFSDFHAVGGGDGWATELNVVWTPVQNFVVRTEIVYQDFDTGAIDEDGVVSGFVRFSRFF